MEALLGVGRGQVGRKGKPAGSGGGASPSGCPLVGVQCRQGSWRIVLKIICSDKKRHKSLRIGEALARLSQGESDERKKQAALLMIEMPLKMTAQSHPSFEGFERSSRPYVDLPPARHAVLYDP